MLLHGDLCLFSLEEMRVGFVISFLLNLLNFPLGFQFKTQRLFVVCRIKLYCIFLVKLCNSDFLFFGFIYDFHVSRA